MKKFHLLLLGATALFASSCNRYYYKPNGVNAPMFTDGGQIRVGVAGSTGTGDGAGKTNFFDIQAAYSPIKHLGIIANYSTYAFTPDNPDILSGNVNARAYLAEAGVGGYFPLGDRKVKMVVDGYAGGGIGNIESDINMKVRKLFFQPGIGMASPWIDVGFNMRLTNIAFSDLYTNGRPDTYLEDRFLIDYTGRRIDEGSHTFFEPAITLRTGYKFAKAQFQSVFANPVSNIPWRHNGARFTVGFYLSVEGIVDAIREGNTKTAPGN